MPRLLTVLLATSLAGGSFASAEAEPFSLPGLLPPLSFPFQHANPSPRRYDQYGRVWRRYPPNYGAETAPAAMGVLIGGVLTNPCFSGGCYFYPGDLDYGASWGSTATKDVGSTTAAYRAASNLASSAATYTVMVEPGSEGAPSHARRRAHKPRLTPGPQQP